MGKKFIRRKSLRKRRFVFVLILVAILATISLAVASGFSENIMLFVSGGERFNPPSTGTHEIGKTESIIENGDKLSFGAHYPVLGNAKIDPVIKQAIDKIIFECKLTVEENAEINSKNNVQLNIDYESFITNKNVISIKFSVFVLKPTFANPELYAQTMNFDLKSGKLLTLNDVFRKSYLQKLSEVSKKKLTTEDKYKNIIDSSLLDAGTAPLEENFKNIALKKDAIVIYFQSSKVAAKSKGLVSIAIPYKDLEGYVKIIGSEVSDTTDNKLPTPPPPRKLDPNKPMIALTFDDGPHPTYTNQILDTLKKYKSVATFFVVGDRVSSFPEAIKRAVSEGSEIGNHSWGHKDLTTLTGKDIDGQINPVEKAVFNVSGLYPECIRPPYGAVNKSVLKQTGLPSILWSVDTLDWKNRDSNLIFNNATKSVRDGDIILFHDIYRTSADAIDRIVPDLIQKGYQLVTISELLTSKGDPIEAKVYTNLEKSAD